MRLSMFSFVFLICARHCIRFSSWFFWRVCVCQYIFLNFQEFLWYYAQVVVTIWLKFRMVSLNRFLWPVCNTIMHKDIRQKFIVNFIYSFERNSYFSFLSFHSDFSIFSFHICWNFSPVKCDCSLSLYIAKYSVWIDITRLGRHTHTRDSVEFCALFQFFWCSLTFPFNLVIEPPKSEWAIRVCSNRKKRRERHIRRSKCETCKAATLFELMLHHKSNDKV